jgi:hypothetical protein
MRDNINTIRTVFNETKSNKSHDVDFKIMKRIRSTIKSVEEDYEQLLQEAQEKIPFRPKKERTSRSLNPLDWVTGSIGSVARELFGVASEEDVQKLTSYVTVLRKCCSGQCYQEYKTGQVYPHLSCFCMEKWPQH